MFAPTSPPWPLRSHQREAIDAVEAAYASGRDRAWVVLPPGGGKTLVGLEVLRAQGRRAVVLCPNTAIQAQWCATWESYADPADTAGTDRALTDPVTVLTYQSLAVFDRDEPPTSDGDVLGRLHPRGRELVERLVAAGPLTLVLDECHHLLEVWGRLLAELLALLPDARVLGLTATPPTVLTTAQAELVGDLFGEVTYAASIPAAVRRGYLAPFAEMAWFTEPTPQESQWLAGQAERFTRLVTDLMDPAFGSVPLLVWLDRRFDAATVPWTRRERDDPDLSAAALRLVHAGLLGLPEGARLREEHRHAPSAQDWAVLLDDWVQRCLRASGDPGDAEVVEAVGRVLPSVGHRLTRHGVRRGRSPVDRVLARSAAKAGACVELVDAESRTLGDRLRMLVVCDHESATATSPEGVGEVLDDRAGSARLMLSRLVADDRTRRLGPALVTGRTVAAAASTARALVAHVADADPALAASLSLEPWDDDPAVSQLVGPWSSRQWVRHVTSFLESGGCQVLVGTRALLGEGWDARGLNALVDLSVATTVSAVVQTRGRTLRTDPRWSDKVAVTWSVVCVTEQHPRGQGDWDRFTRKHEGYFGVDDVGEVVAGVAHVDATLSPYAPPAVADFDALNARMLARAEDRRDVADRWRVGEPYEDTVVHTLRVRPARPTGRPPAAATSGVGEPPPTLLGPDGLRRVAGSPRTGPWTTVREVAGRPPLPGLAAAVADGLHGAGLTSAGADAVVVLVEPDGTQRFSLRTDEDGSALFARCLDEVLGPLGAPRYVVPRHLLGVAPGWSARTAGWRRLVGRLRADGVVWHAVPTPLGVNARALAPFARAWTTWVGDGAPEFTGSPVGTGVLASHRGSSPLDVLTVLRPQWR